MKSDSFTLQPHLDTLNAAAPRRLAFQAKSLAEMGAWQAELRLALSDLLGLTDREPLPVQAELVQTTDRGRYLEEKRALDVGEGVLAPLYVLVPKGKPPFPTVLAFHGHDPSVQTILGTGLDEQFAPLDDAPHTHYARSLAEAGYLVCAVEQRGLGERSTEQAAGEPFPRSCRHLAFSYLLHGRTLLGERCWDGMQAIRYLQTRSDVQQGWLACTGHSGGGTTALFLTALNPSISVLVLSGYFCSFRDSILAMPHCECNYLPGVLTMAEMGDIGALLAPRPFAVVHGEADPIFPVSATRSQFETVARAYSLLGRDDACSLLVHPGAHRYDFPASEAWLERWRPADPVRAAPPYP